MPESIATRSVVVTNPEGIHARAAVVIAETVRRSKSRVIMIKDRERVEATDVLQLLAMGAGQGQRVEIEAEGPDAIAVLDALEPLFAGQFGDEAKKSV
jgi:phosphotransferase system HPr (HPr) family protein